MLIDARRLDPGQDIVCDLCVIGGGAAGLAMAMEFAGSTRSVVVLEAGDAAPDADSQSFLDGETRDAAHPEPSLYRHRRLGGSTAIWGGRCIPLDPIDFERRDWVAHSGWPIGRETLDPFYARAQDVLDAGAFDYGVGALRDGALIEGFVDGAMRTDAIERFSLPTDVWRKYRRPLRDAVNIRVIANAACVDLPPEDGHGAVAACIFAAPDGTRYRLRATQYVIAAGGLETYRLMANCWADRGGIGNAGGWLGRGYMCHLEIGHGAIRLDPPRRPVSFGFEKTRDAVYARRKLTLSPEFQREQRVLNASVRLHHAPVADPRHGDGILSLMYIAKNTVIPEYRRKLAMIDHVAADAMDRRGAFWARHLRNVAMQAPKVGAFAAGWAVRHTLARRKLPYVALKSPVGLYAVDMNLEQEPQRDSRVTLADGCDRHGMRRLAVDWRISPLDRRTVLAAYEALGRSLAASGVGHLDHDAIAIAERAGDAVAVGGHHIGLARMADGPADGVVDAHCRVHGVANLHIAGAAVFPTSGHANPTLTIVALALRLADRLKAST